MSLIIGRPKHEMAERTKAIRHDFVRRYPDADALRENLFYIQLGVCEICKKPMLSAEAFATVIDHAIPLFVFAEASLPIEEACEQANSLKNLTGVHTTCNGSKGGLDFEEFTERIVSGDLKIGQSPTLEDIRWMQEKNSEGSRKSGLKTGRKNFENKIGLFGRTPEQHFADSRKSGLKNKANGTGIFAPENRGKGGRTCAENKIGACGRSPEKMSEDGRKAGLKNKENGTGIFAPGMASKGGRIAGRMAAENGQLDRIRELPQTKRAQRRNGRIQGRIQGRKAKENGTGIFAPENVGKGGRKCAENGHMTRMSALPQTKRAQRRWGRIIGRKHKENGTGVFAPGMQAKGGRITGRKHKENGTGIFGLSPEQKSEVGRKSGRVVCHIRWHVRRNLRNPNCPLCQEAV